MNSINFDKLFGLIKGLSQKQELNTRGRRLCIQYKKTGSCTRGKICNFSHTPSFTYEYSSEFNSAVLNRYFCYIVDLSNNPQFVSNNGKRVVIDESLTAAFLEASIQLNFYMQKKQFEVDPYGDVYDFFVGTVWLFCARLEAIMHSLNHKSKDLDIYKAIYADCFITSYKMWLDYEEEVRSKCESMLYAINDTSSRCNQALNQEIQLEANRLIGIVEQSACVREEIIEKLLGAFKKNMNAFQAAHPDANQKPIRGSGVGKSKSSEVAMSLQPFGSSCNMFGFGTHTDLDLVFLYGAEYLELAYDYNLLYRHHLKSTRNPKEDACPIVPDYDPVVILHLCKDAALETGEFQVLEVVEKARVPILKLHHIHHDMDVDICINNAFPLHNTKLLRQYASYDVVVRYLAFAVKHWAKCRQVNSPHNSSFSSYTWVLLVIHFLQSQSFGASNSANAYGSIESLADGKCRSRGKGLKQSLLPSIPYPCANAMLDAPDCVNGLATDVNNMKIKQDECVVQGLSSSTPNGTGLNLPSTENIATLLCKFFAYYSTEGIGGFKPSARVGIIDRQYNVKDTSRVMNNETKGNEDVREIVNNGKGNNLQQNAPLYMKQCTKGALYAKLCLLFCEEGHSSELCVCSTAGSGKGTEGLDNNQKNFKRNRNRGQIKHKDKFSKTETEVDLHLEVAEASCVSLEPAETSVDVTGMDMPFDAPNLLVTEEASSGNGKDISRVSANSTLTWRFAIEDPLDYHDLGSVVYHRLGQANMMTELRRAYLILLNASDSSETVEGARASSIGDKSVWATLCEKIDNPPLFPYLCKYCEEAHSSRDCPFNLCYICNKSGHIGRNCPVKLEREGRRKLGRGGDKEGRRSEKNPPLVTKLSNDENTSKADAAIDSGKPILSKSKASRPVIDREKWKEHRERLKKPQQTNVIQSTSIGSVLNANLPVSSSSDCIKHNERAKQKRTIQPNFNTLKPPNAVNGSGHGNMHDNRMNEPTVDEFSIATNKERYRNKNRNGSRNQ